MKMKIALKIKPDYTCRQCGIKEEGTDTYRVEVSSVKELQDTIYRQYTFDPPRQGIPVGWSSNGTFGVKCNNCKGV